MIESVPRDDLSIKRTQESILGSLVDVIGLEQLLSSIENWVSSRSSASVCIANVHSIVTAFLDSDFHRILSAADLVITDGMPLVWILRRRGYRDQIRLYGPTVMKQVSNYAAQHGLSVGFYGGTPATLDRLVDHLHQSTEGHLRVAFQHSPTFGTAKELYNCFPHERLRESATQILFLGLGCPKQEELMSLLKGDHSIVMLGVGAAFDFFSGQVAMAPKILQDHGLEWAYRLSQEPKRLLWRYVRTNTIFLPYLVKELLLPGKGSKAIVHSD